MKITFEDAHKFTTKWEKGLVDHPQDPGGITKNGISIRFLADYAKREEAFLKQISVILPITPDSIRKLTEEQEKRIFEKAFWLPFIPASVPPLVAVTIYDASVNSGQGQAIKFLQRACNSYKFTGDALTVDGAIGPKTRIRAMELGKEDNGEALALLSIEYRNAFYRGLSTFKTFGKGWLNRTSDLITYISTLARRG